MVSLISTMVQHKIAHMYIITISKLTATKKQEANDKIIIIEGTQVIIPTDLRTPCFLNNKNNQNLLQ